CGAELDPTYPPFDNISPAASSITYSFSDATGSFSISYDPFSNSYQLLPLPFGDHMVTATAHFCNQSTLSCTFKVTVTGAPVPTITCPVDFTVFANPLTCNALVSFSGSHAALSPDATQIIYSYGGVLSTTSLFLPYGENIVTAKATIPCVGDKTCTFTVTVAPNPQDIVFNCPGPVTVACSKDVPGPDIRSVTLSYFCATFTVEYVGDVISNQTCANRYTITRTYRVKEVPSVTCSQTITVFDNSPPVISNVSVSSATLWPPNHKMQTVTVGYDVLDNCGATSSLSVSSNQPINGTGDGDTSPDWVITDDHHVQLRAERGNSTDGRIYTITVTANDGCNATSTAITTVTVAHNINSPVTGTPFRIGSTVNFSGVFWDKPANKHTAAWLINDNISVKGTVTEPSGTKNGKVTGSYKFGSTGIYRLQMNVTDQNKVTSYANTNEDLEEIIVIYDPNGGYAYGGGNFASPKGALVSNPSATGKVTYGFTVNYYKGATLPKGQTQFNFNVGGFKYDAVNFDYLSVAGYKAVFKGSGKILGGQSGINFIMYVIDGALDGSGVDKVRLKIYNKNTSQVYYDNEPGKSDAADPVTKVGVNSQVVISGTPLVTQAKKIPSETLPLATELTVRVYPNPTQNLFALQVESANQNDQIILQVFDLLGRLVETRTITQGLTDRIGSMYKPGTYLFKVIQGNDHKEFKVLKLPGLIF
ncbi:T9SS type A sorting domain-containing protein, partial [Flavisolibacter ginsengisoli]